MNKRGRFNGGGEAVYIHTFVLCPPNFFLNKGKLYIFSGKALRKKAKF